MLEKEFELVNASEIVGGVDPSPYKLEDGYCYFNCLAYAMLNSGNHFYDGTTADLLKNSFERSITNGLSYDQNGHLIGASSTGIASYDNALDSATNTTSS